MHGGLHTIDTKPLIHCNPKIVKEEILCFLQLFQKAPLCCHRCVSQINIGDLFWIYYTLKKYNPSIVIENNIVGDGLSWLINKVCPTSRIISLCDNINEIPYININLKNDYIETNFMNINWNQELGFDHCNNALVISTNSENDYEISSHAYDNKIPYIIFTNNYPTTQGFQLTIKKILSHNYHISQNNNNLFDIYSIPSSYKRRILNMYEYFEFPPVYNDRQITRWNDYFCHHECKNPIFEKEEEYLSSFIKTQLSYTFICLLKLK